MLRRVAISLLLTFAVSSACAQFYSTGRDRTSIKWNQIDSSHYRIAYPVGFEVPAARVALLFDSLYAHIDYGINFPLQKLPIVLHTQNVLSNGYVTWAPKRSELMMVAPTDNYALLWSKQLPMHEWRHVAQLSALRRGITRIASWVFGQGGVGFGVLFTPHWILEGDATLAETQFAEFGRGLQPDFTVEYRALFADGHKDFKRLDRWICGSYNRHYPDIYKFGYQTLSAADQYLGSHYIGEMLAYAGRWPIFVMPTDIYLKHKHKTSFKKIARQAFAELDSLWRPHAEVEPNFTLSTLPLRHTYTTYSYPTQVAERTVALKSDYDTPSRLVDLTTGRRIKAIGYVTSRPIAHRGKLYFTEYVPHPIFEQTNFSVIRALDLGTGRVENFDRRGRNFFITPTHTGFAAVGLDGDNNSYIKFFDNRMRPSGSHRFNIGEITLHGLAFDSVTRTLGFIALDKRGMWLGALDSLTVRELTAPNVVSISDLSASGGKLYFSSIESGKNEIHCFDLQSGVQSRLTLSRFGSSMPSAGDDSLRLITYTSSGAMVASMPIDAAPLDTVQWSRLPQNHLNLMRRKWNVPSVDTLDFETIASLDTAAIKSRRKNRFIEPFAIHTWMPFALDGDYIMENRPISVAFGVTAFFQTSLSKLAGFVTYGWDKTNWLKGRVHYKGLPFDISVGAEYGAGYQSLFGGAAGVAAPADRELYLNADLTLSLPLNLSIGGFSQLLQPSFTVAYDNGLVYNDQLRAYESGGFARFGASLWWSSYRNRAHRNLNPRWGYAVRANVNGAFSRDFGTLYSLYAKGYLPGVAKNHSVAITLGGQFQDLSTFNFSSKPFYLKGVSDSYVARSYAAAQVDYALPLACPDWGWEGVIYLSRISANFFGGYSTGRYVTNVARQYAPLDFYTYGVDLKFDFTLIRAYAQSMTFTFAAPSDKGFYFGFTYGFGFF